MNESMSPEGTTITSPNRFCPLIVAIVPQSFSPIGSLVTPAALSKVFLQMFAHWHVPRATWHQSLRDWHHLFSAVPARRIVPSRSRSTQPFLLQVPKCLNRQTDRHTHTHIHTLTSLAQLFFSASHQEEISELNNFNDKALKSLYSTILN